MTFEHTHTHTHTQFPPAATMPNNKGKIPLHYAAREGRGEMVRFFLQAVPACAFIASKKHKLALHFAAGEGHVQIVRDLLTVHPAGASVLSAKGKVALHFCARWGHLQIAHDLLAVYPEGARALDWESSLPIHDAAREGQYEMSRVLMEQFPSGLATANMRGETPLFPAVRSGNVDLVTLFVQAWPVGAKYVLRDISEDDDLENWDILELLLRGATGNLSDCKLLQGKEPPSVYLKTETCMSPVRGDFPVVDSMEKKVDAPLLAEATRSFFVDSHQNPQPADVPAPNPWTRCKSPILDTTIDRKKRPVGGRKRQRSRDFSMEDNELKRMAFPRQFLPLHAAAECGASAFVNRMVLEKRPEDKWRPDESGRLPLHWAVTHCRSGNEEMILFVLNELCLPECAVVRDKSGQLPLHLAIMANADVRVIEALLEAFPCSGVESCGSNTVWCTKKPIDMALHYQNDLSTIYRLLRVEPSYIHSFLLSK